MAGETSDRTTRAEGKLIGIENSLKEIKDQLEALCKKVNRMDDKVIAQGKMMEKIEEIRQSNRSIEEGLNELKAENKQLKTRIAKIEKGAEIQAMKERRNQVEIAGVPVKVNEKPEELILNLAREAKVEVQKKDIESCYRIKSREGRDGPIIIKFKESRKRDTVMKELKNRRPTLEMINMEPTQRKIYINESLTPNAKSILYRAKIAAREKGWNRVWTYAGTVYLKIEREGTQIKIESLEEMEILLK